jgi:bifunctional DNA primase/polymerase-like protein
MTRSTLPAALAAARRDWAVFPLRPGDKRPLPSFTDWEHHATTDPDRISAFWSRGPFNVAIACGPSHLVVVDLDTPKSGKTPPPDWELPGVHDGADVLAVLCERHHQSWPGDTFTVRTRSGGMQLYFTPPTGSELRNTSGRLGWLIDTRAAGGYVVAPGSVVPDDDGQPRTYEVVNDAPAAPLPDWLTGLLNPAPLPAPALGAPWLADGIGDLDAYASAALKAEAGRVAAAQPGGRNSALNKAAYNMGRLVGAGAVPEEIARTVLHEAASGLFSRGKDGFTPVEAAATITAALAAGIRRPRTITRRATP